LYIVYHRVYRSLFVQEHAAECGKQKERTGQ